jgi:hypothetical protein
MWRGSDSCQSPKNESILLLSGSLSGAYLIAEGPGYEFMPLTALPVWAGFAVGCAKAMGESARTTNSIVRKEDLMLDIVTFLIRIFILSIF